MQRHAQKLLMNTHADPLRALETAALPECSPQRPLMDFALGALQLCIIAFLQFQGPVRYIHLFSASPKIQKKAQIFEETWHFGLKSPVF
jgi:hypothetical protein